MLALTAAIMAMATVAAPPDLVAAIEHRANQQLAAPGQQVKVQRAWWPSGRGARVKAQAVEIEFNAGEDFSGRSSVRLRQDGRRYWLRVTFVRLVETPVAARPLPSGHLLQEADVTRSRVPLAELAGHRPLRPEQVLGRKLRRRLKAGQPLRDDWLERPLLVRRGDRLLLRARARGVVVEVAARALASARVGDRLPVENLQSGKRVVGRLQAGPVVVVELDRARAGR